MTGHPVLPLSIFANRTASPRRSSGAPSKVAYQRLDPRFCTQKNQSDILPTPSLICTGREKSSLLDPSRLWSGFETEPIRICQNLKHASDLNTDMEISPIPHLISTGKSTRNSSGDEIANVNFLRRHRTRTTAHNKGYFAYGKHTCP